LERTITEKQKEERATNKNEQNKKEWVTSTKMPPKHVKIIGEKRTEDERE